MILECPSCHARFSVADHLIPAEGRDVRCSKCAHHWHVMPTPPLVVPSAQHQETPADPAFDRLAAALAEPEVTVIPVAPEGRNAAKPERKRKPISPKPFKIAVPLIALCWIAVAFIAYFPGWSKSALSGVYEMFGAVSIEGLTFSDVHMEREQAGTKTRFILTGSVHNNASVERTVPTVRVQLKNEKNKTIWMREYPVNTVLKAGDVYPFRITNVETTLVKSVTSIVVDMGNPMQLLVR